MRTTGDRGSVIAVVQGIPAVRVVDQPLLRLVSTQRGQIGQALILVSPRKCYRRGENLNLDARRQLESDLDRSDYFCLTVCIIGF